MMADLLAPDDDNDFFSRYENIDSERVLTQAGAYTRPLLSST
jgi:hypothetical protein